MPQLIPHSLNGRLVHTHTQPADKTHNMIVSEECGMSTKEKSNNRWKKTRWQTATMQEWEEEEDQQPWYDLLRSPECETKIRKRDTHTIAAVYQSCLKMWKLLRSFELPLHLKEGTNGHNQLQKLGGVEWFYCGWRMLRGRCCRRFWSFLSCIFLHFLSFHQGLCSPLLLYNHLIEQKVRLICPW